MHLSKWVFARVHEKPLCMQLLCKGSACKSRNHCYQSVLWQFSSLQSLPASEDCWTCRGSFAFKKAEFPEWTQLVDGSNCWWTHLPEWKGGEISAWIILSPFVWRCVHINLLLCGSRCWQHLPWGMVCIMETDFLVFQQGGTQLGRRQFMGSWGQGGEGKGSREMRGEQSRGRILGD